MALILATVKENVSLSALDAESGDIVAAIVEGGFHVGGSRPEALVYINY